MKYYIKEENHVKSENIINLGKSLDETILCECIVHAHGLNTPTAALGLIHISHQNHIKCDT